MSCIGEEVRHAREAAGFAISDLARDLSIHPRYIVALENGNYRMFSAKIYAEGVLKKILTRLNITDPKDCIARFAVEWTDKKENGALAAQSRRQRHDMIGLRHRLILCAGGAAMILVLLFFGTRLLFAFQTPKLEILSPSDNLVTRAPFTVVKGRVGPESGLTVNGREIKMGGQGEFEEYIGLQPGLNILTFVVEDHVRKTQTRVRRVVVE